MKTLILFFTCISFSVYPQQIPTTLSEIYKGKIKLDFSQSAGELAGIWRGGSSMPYPRYYGASIVYSSNDTTWLYVFGGDTTGNGDATKACLRYNVASDSWEYIDTLPIPMRVNSAARLGNKLYTMGGFSGRNPSAALRKFYEYDINTNLWSELPDLPEGIFYHKSFGYKDSLIYILGGITFDSTFYRDKILIYNINTMTFREASSLPEQRANFAFVVFNDTIYITGGLYSSDSLSNKTIIGAINPVDHSQISYFSGNDSTSFYPIQVHSHFGYPSGKDSINFFGGSISIGFNPVNNSYSLMIPEIKYDTLANVGFKTTAFHSGYGYSFINPGSDSIVTVIVAGGVTTGSSITGETWIYRDSIAVTGLTDIKNNLPETYTLYQNYPNPFNPSTTIQFSIPEQTFVKLEIFNSLGEKVSTLVSEMLSAGIYKYNYNVSSGKSLSSGTYFYRITANEFTDTKKFLFLK